MRRLVQVSHAPQRLDAWRGVGGLRRVVLLPFEGGAATGHAAARWTRRPYATSSGRAGRGDPNVNQAKEDEEDRILEEEEFAALRETDGDEFMPIAHRLAHKADALDAELRRIRYCLCDRPQFLVDTAAATLTGRATRVDRVLAALQSQQRKRSSSDASTAGAESAQSLPRTGNLAGSAGTVTESDLRASPYASWTGTSSALLRFVSLGVLWRRASVDAAAAHGREVATLDANLDYLRRGRALHQLNYYSRLNLTPKRNVWLALFQVLWNCIVSTQNAVGCVVYGTLRGVKEGGLVAGGARGAARGVAKAAAFLAYGWVASPALHLSTGLCNTVYGPLTCFTGKYVFDSLSGRWMRCTVLDARLFRHELQREKRVLRTIGRAEFRRKRMTTEHKWAERLASMGFTAETLRAKFMPKGARGPNGEAGAGPGGAGSQMRNPYEVLQVRRTANTQEIKKQYKKLAMVFHPDVAQSRRGGGGPLSPEEKAEAQRKFEEIASAYQILSNAEKRKAYDLGGAQGIHLHETKFGKFMSRTPAEMVQGVFGGEAFRRVLIGEVLRSHWALRSEAQVSVSMHDLEELQCIRIRQLAIELAAIADVHAQRPTTPYYGGASAGAAAAAAAAATGGGHRRPSGTASSPGGTSSSSLPEYLNSGKRRPERRDSAGGLRNPVGDGMARDMHDSIMEELGGGGGSGARKAPRGVRGKGPQPSGPQDAESPQAASPFVLHPGSCGDNCFSRDFEERCDRFVRHLSEACFGKQLLHEVGEAYVTSAQRFLGVRPFYAPKVLVWRKIGAGFDRIFEAILAKAPSDTSEATRKVMAEYFNMEYDTVVADAHLVLRYALQLVLQDAAETAEVRRKRCYAVWYLGERMLAAGERWTPSLAKDEDFVAYLQQAATSAASTSRPPAF